MMFPQAMSSAPHLANTNANYDYQSRDTPPTKKQRSSHDHDDRDGKGGGAGGLGEDLIQGHDRPWTEEKERILLAAYDYLEGHPGKDIRSAMIAAFNQWLEVPPKSMAVITKVIGMLHTASLL
jgi:hypothetical protein